MRTRDEFEGIGHRIGRFLRTRGCHVALLICYTRLILPHIVGSDLQVLWSIRLY